jgi:hypothetical protein
VAEQDTVRRLIKAIKAASPPPPPLAEPVELTVHCGELADSRARQPDRPEAATLSYFSLFERASMLCVNQRRHADEGTFLIDDLDRKIANGGVSDWAYQEMVRVAWPGGEEINLSALAECFKTILETEGETIDENRQEEAILSYHPLYERSMQLEYNLVTHADEFNFLIADIEQKMFDGVSEFARLRSTKSAIR